MLQIRPANIWQIFLTQKTLAQIWHNWCVKVLSAHALVHSIFFFLSKTSLSTSLVLLLNSAAAEQQNTVDSQTFTQSGALMLDASQSKSNFLEMFEHNIDNQSLIASNTACHLPTVTQKKNNKKKPKAKQAMA